MNKSLDKAKEYISDGVLNNSSNIDEKFSKLGKWLVFSSVFGIISFSKIISLNFEKIDFITYDKNYSSEIDLFIFLNASYLFLNYLILTVPYINIVKLTKLLDIAEAQTDVQLNKITELIKQSYDGFENSTYKQHYDDNFEREFESIVYAEIDELDAAEYRSTPNNKRHEYIKHQIVKICAQIKIQEKIVDTVQEITRKNFINLIQRNLSLLILLEFFKVALPFVAYIIYFTYYFGFFIEGSQLQQISIP